MNELALFAGAGIMKPLIQETSWKPSDAANAVTICRYLRFTSAQAQSRTTRLARSASVQWQRTGTSATRTRQQPRCVNGGNKTLMPSRSTAPKIGKSITAKNSFGNTALIRHGSMSSCNAKAMPVCAASELFNGATSKPRRTSITATTRKLCEGFSATVAIPSLACAKTTTSCYPLWRGI